MPPLNRLRQVLEQNYAPQLSSQRERTVLTPEEEMLLETPGYNPNASAQPPVFDRLGPVADAVNSVMGRSRSSELEGLRNRMEEEGRPDTPAWRTAAAIGSSFLAPLRAGGVPEMLYTSPEQRDWDQRSKNRMSILEQEYGLEQEGIRQRGAAANTLAKEGADVYKVQHGAYGYSDPLQPGHTQVLSSGQKMVTRSPDGRVTTDAVNNPPMTYDPNQVYVDGEGSVTMPYAPTSTPDSRTLLHPDQYGGYATNSPGAESRDATEKFVEDLKGQFSREVANIKAGADVNSARIQAGASMYGADRGLEGTRYSADRGLEETRYSADRGLEGIKYGADRRLSGEQLNANSRVQAAAMRGAQGGGADPVSRARQTALKNFFDSVQRARRDLFKDGAPTDPAEVQRGLLLLRNAFDTYKGGIEDLGGAVGDVDLEQIYNDIQQNSGWFGGSSMDPSSVAMAFELATSQAIQALGPQAAAAPGYAPAPAPAAPAAPPITEVSPQQLQEVGDPTGEDFQSMREMFPDRPAQEILQAIANQNRRAGTLQAAPAPASTPTAPASVPVQAPTPQPQAPASPAAPLTRADQRADMRGAAQAGRPEISGLVDAAVAQQPPAMTEEEIKRRSLETLRRMYPSMTTVQLLQMLEQ